MRDDYESDLDVTTSNVYKLGSRIMKAFSSSIPTLQAAADSAYIQANVRQQANRQLILSVVLLAQGVIEYPHRGSFAALVGCVILGVEAIWLLRVRHPSPLLAASVLLWAVAVWDGYIAIQGNESYWLWAALYVFVGFREFSGYRKFRTALLTQTPESQAEFALISAALNSSDKEMIFPHVEGDRWAGLLLTNGIALKDAKGQVTFLARDSTEIEQRGASIIGGFRRVNILGHGRKLSCTLQDGELMRLLAWRSLGRSNAAVAK